MLEGICSTEERLLGAKFDDLTKVVCVEMSRYGSDNGIRFVSTYSLYRTEGQISPTGKKRFSNRQRLTSHARSCTVELVPLGISPVLDGWR